MYVVRCENCHNYSSMFDHPVNKWRCSCGWEYIDTTPNKPKLNRPERKVCKHPSLCGPNGDCDNCAWNACCDAWEAYLKDAMEDLLKKELPVLKLKPCLCDRKEAKTVKRITSQIWQCPRCGGLGSILDTDKLVPLDEDKVFKALRNWDYQDTDYISDNDLKSFAKKICQTFGTLEDNNLMQLDKEKLLKPTNKQDYGGGMRREIKFRAWDGLRMTTSGIQFSATTGELSMINNYPLMQYTGIKDKNGKEIYEGDIIECEQLILEVKWEYDGFEYLDCDGRSILVGKHNIERKLEFFKIIGNIYKNPELIQKEKE